MGWLFAVALGMQDRDRGAVHPGLAGRSPSGTSCRWCSSWRRCSGSGWSTDTSALHLGAGVALVAFGVFRFIKPRAHPRWTTMRVNRARLAWWSFLMSSAHGAGLMVAPVLIGAGAASASATITRSRRPAGAARRCWTSAVGLVLHVAAMVAGDGARGDAGV